MSIGELFIIAVGLSMDAFAVSVCKGLSAGRVRLGHALTAGIWFGGFQALMPFLGWLLGSRFQSFISNVDHWIAFLLLGLIGLNMVRESRSQEEEEVGASFAPKAMLPLAVATSIDALTVGITFAFLQLDQADILWAVSLIGVTTFVLSAIGVKAGGIVGERGKSRAELAGGIVLILMGCKILVEHLGLI
ncbi:manganese efflux pump MntP family protein [Pseudoflavonifractor phocaeensis]|uniref:manganese efflux pump MntP n=1 Tax=Pseudoflavonifractor phocaeensis TaxID=1870988 RepID=UPI0025A41115|nr:manganese efflux pump MntP family protein [Pseudoflavonifractor phocaeensis]MDM8239043.1 manganese efflux pump MntP family protein [Pseudoflavonifractor phocaeensis]